MATLTNTRQLNGNAGADHAAGRLRSLTEPGVLDQYSVLFSCYTAQLVFRDKILGGVPKDPRLIEGWLRAKAGIDDASELRAAMLRTLAEVGADAGPEMSDTQLAQASDALAARRLTTGFKVGTEGLYIEARQVKALLKESTNILFGGERWGATRKGPKSFLAERVFVQPERLWLGIDKPAGLELIVGHINGPQGPQSTLGYHKYAVQPVLDFSVLVVRDAITPAQWAERSSRG